MKMMDEISVLSDEDKKLLGEVKGLIQGAFPTAEIFLYGSVATGHRGPESDYDILVLTDEAMSNKEQDELERQVLDLELARDVILSTIYHTKEEWRLRRTLPFHNEVEKHGVVL